MLHFATSRHIVVENKGIENDSDQKRKKTKHICEKLTFSIIRGLMYPHTLVILYGPECISITIYELATLEQMRGIWNAKVKSVW
ncbi:hypothetical protein PENTCL1PPCAC_13416, partial [Pristionchus entomophagus]